MALLSDLIGPYKAAWQQLSPLLAGNNSGGDYAGNLDASQNVAPTGNVVPLPTQTQNDKLDANPQIIPISDAEAANAQAQQGGPAPDPARVAALQAQAQPIAAPMNGAQAGQAPTAAAMPSAQVSPSTVATVSADTGSPSPSDYNADGTQASGGGLLSTLAGVGQQAASDPVKAKGLLSSLGDYATGLGDKLKNMSPAASQALIASGMTMLAGNDGTRNVAQLAGMGGIAGMNQYQTVTQNQIANRLAQQKLAQDLVEKQATNAVANYNAQTERFKATNAPTAVEPGRAIVTPGSIASGQAPTMVSGPGGQLPIARTVEVTDGQGNTYTQGLDIWGNKVGTPQPKTMAYTGPLNGEQQKTVNEANSQAAKSAFGLQRTQSFMTKLMPTIPDPNNPGQSIPNPDYVPVTGGVGATVQNELNKLTGGQTQSQMLRQEIQQNVYMAQLGNWKPGVGGRLTNADITLLKQGMPPDNANGNALQQYLQAYAHLQEDQATHDALNAQYMTANRGDSSPLHSAATIGGVQYPAGTTMQQVLSRQSPVRSKGNANTQQAQDVISKAQAAARAGDTSAQAALKQRGLSW